MNHSARPSSAIDASLRTLSRGFAADAAQFDPPAGFPASNIGRLRDAGLLALTVPKRYGGLGGGLLDTVRVLGTVAEGCASTSLILAMQVFAVAALHRGTLWPEAVRARISADVVADGALFNALRVEPKSGSRGRGGMPSTVLRRTADGWTLSGHKIVSTGAPGLRWMDVWAAHEGKVGHVLVRGDSPGVRIAETWDHIGTRATYSHDVLFTDVPIEAGHVVLRSPVEWVNADPAQMAWNAAGIGAIHTGIARAARDGILDFLRHRGATGANPLPGALTEIEMLLSANARLIASIATETDEGRPASPKESALVKAMVIENATRSVELAASLAADHAHARATAIDLHIRDARSGRGQAPQAAAAFAAGGRGALN